MTNRTDLLEPSIQSKRFQVWSRLYELLDLNPGGVQPGGRGRVLMAIRPVVDVRELLQEDNILTATVASAVAGANYHSVPDEEEWLLYGYQAVRLAGDRDISELNLLEPGNVGGNSIPIDSFTAASGRTHMFQTPLRLRSGWTLRLFAEGGTTDGDWTVVLLTRVSPAFLT